VQSLLQHLEGEPDAAQQPAPTVHEGSDTSHTATTTFTAPVPRPTSRHEPASEADHQLALVVHNAERFARTGELDVQIEPAPAPAGAAQVVPPDAQPVTPPPQADSSAAPVPHAGATTTPPPQPDEMGYGNQRGLWRSSGDEDLGPGAGQGASDELSDYFGGGENLESHGGTFGAGVQFVNGNPGARPEPRYLLLGEGSDRPVLSTPAIGRDELGLPSTLDPTPLQPLPGLGASDSLVGSSQAETDRHLNRYPAPGARTSPEPGPSDTTWYGGQPGYGTSSDSSSNYSVRTPDGQTAMSVSNPTPGITLVSVAPGQMLVRSALDGELLALPSSAGVPPGWEVIARDGQTLVNGSDQTLLLASGNSAEQTLAAVMAFPALLRTGVGTVGGLVSAGGLGLTSALAGDGALTSGGVVALRALGVLGLAVLPSSLGGGETVQYFNDTTRLVKPESDVRYGHVEFQQQDAQGNAVWVRLEGRMFSAADLAQAQQLQRTSILTPADLARLNEPMIYVANLEQATNPPPLTPPPARDANILPGASVDVPAPWRSTVPGYEAQTPHWSDAIIDRSREEQAEFRRKVIAELLAKNPNFPRRLLSQYEAHHILPLNEYPELQGLRDKFAEWGIDLNSAENGVLLPKGEGIGSGTPHSDTQNNERYMQAMPDRFRDVTTREQALRELSEIKVELEERRLIPSKDKQ
jgi:hypothetical protein